MSGSIRLILVKTQIGATATNLGATQVKKTRKIRVFGQKMTTLRACAKTKNDYCNDVFWVSDVNQRRLIRNEKEMTSICFEREILTF